MDRELILRAARLHAPVKSSDGATLFFFPDFFRLQQKEEVHLRQLGRNERSWHPKFFLLYPATLKVILNQGEPKMLYSPEEARVFLRSLSPTNCILDLPRLSDSDSEYLAEQITLQELESAIRSMNKGKSPGIDGLDRGFITGGDREDCRSHVLSIFTTATCCGRKERTPVVEVQPDDDLQPVHLDQPSGRAARDRIVEHHF
ncbi:hypothetical protein QQF64_036428 [Cirrhinus molitorella]|uniref:Reverse transcriptase n=1 Tax=Cirrhinus molitorella TaxID=172907 RepID=A0ABR3NJN9_9TELE